MRTIGIDLGSNTLRAVEYDCDRETFGPVFGTIVKTADGLAQTGLISQGAVERIVEGLQRLRGTIVLDGARMRAVTTEAMRRAHNREEVLAQIEARAGIRFEVIDGAEEARLTLGAVQHRLAELGQDTNTTDALALVDIGGGSTELIFAYGERIVSRSFPLGIVTITQSYDALDAVREALPELIAPVRTFAEETMSRYGSVDAFVATAGTPTTLASLKHGMEYATYDPRRISGTRLHADEPARHLEQLLAMPFAERERRVGVGRADLILAGIVLFEAFYAILNQEECIVIDDGLREGVALGLCV